MSDKKKELLKKLQALAERGVSGERETAERKLKELIKKYGIEEEELNEDKIIDFDFKYHSEWEKKLLRQLFYKMFGKAYREKNYIYRYGKGSRTTYGIQCTKAEGLQLRVEYDFYRELFKEEFDLFLSAFIQKHNLFSLRPEDIPEGHDPTEEELKQYARMQQMMNGMQDKKLNPMIEERS